MSGRFWALFFLFWAIAALVVSFGGPFLGYGFPGDGQAYSTIGMRIDWLFTVILVVVTITFVLTQAALVYVLWQGASNKTAQHSHGNHTLEVAWTVIPGIVLLFLAIYQMDVWAEYRIKTFIPKDNEPIAEVTARQFEWRIRYPSPGKKLHVRPVEDDLHAVNELRMPVGRPVSINLRSEDVQHSFFVPHLRIKQDAIPGKIIPVWFTITKPGNYDLVCAELCGWGHYKMKARVVALPEEEFQSWKQQALKDQFSDGTSTDE